MAAFELERQRSLLGSTVEIEIGKRGIRRNCIFAASAQALCCPFEDLLLPLRSEAGSYLS
jgi:hypothetical protein